MRDRALTYEIILRKAKSYVLVAHVRRAALHLEERLGVLLVAPHRIVGRKQLRLVHASGLSRGRGEVVGCRSFNSVVGDNLPVGAQVNRKTDLRRISHIVHMLLVVS